MVRLTFYIVTFNVATKSPNQPLGELLQWNGRTEQQLPDFCLFGIQEVKAQPQNLLLDSVFDDPWTAALRDVISDFDYIKIRTVKMVGLLLNVFCKRKHISHLKEMEISETPTGLLGLWGNKGAVSFSFKIHDTTICCINCHFAAHEENLKHRIDDYHTIIKSQYFGSSKKTILNHDYVFWFGDLNFRLDNSSLKSAEEIAYTVNNVESSYKTANILTDIWAQDELNLVMKKSLVFKEFVEELPMFPPTYRYIIGSCRYDVKRRPAWTDRILYKAMDSSNKKCALDILSYKYIESIKLSDHKPVYGESSIQLNKGFCKANSTYNQPIIFQQINTWQLEEVNEVNLRIKDYIPCVNDWIGVFNEKYTSLEDYLSYVYLPSEMAEIEESNLEYRRFNNIESAHRVKFLPEIFPDGSKSVCLNFSETAVLNPGTYRLIYFSSSNNSVLGLSNPFIASKHNSTLNTSHEFGW
ncbi:Endonuclease/exonuclease/phosphatase,Inositol polyphosphate-related phosphatase [Cinara cedri]|uniref:Endonuclease/exonuclease/phosphatase,Inositol polyphosphate-related phosphatase n=1 Tax=Cinara cedri TaxID=506608 RepID=A0A5E4MS54_9HEMI|nr:Endonuclease/exonuclease/phosphatase,Inositol polyphosphate-related phosphatase [Cinara cedri]